MKQQGIRYSTNRECAHAWAHQHAAAGHTGNLFFEGPTIYSYGKHFPIAMVYGNTVFFTMDSYSSTTSQHKNLAAAAVSHKEIMYVPLVPHDENELKSPSF